ncbi:AAA family ATPase [Paenibacillus sp. GCM10012307]|uniref:MoxR family ATPase n=1 Tax=Paenibacillus roseus TaxID=2798579 RepID=A0A934IV96_9BACL|nr:MoxR family ATPase [Paenibacillus roseus]MBJ6359957.1 MoxR family ATPase [Paenibacillus roseus]
MKLTEIKALTDTIRNHVSKVIVGKDEVIDKLLIALMTSGHILLEDVPGTGKTMIAKAVAKSIDCDFKRIQFTPDLLPSDLSGIQFFNQKASEFEFRPGPLFTNILLADEINRATPRTQSSLLECMEERQVSVDGQTYKLNRPFLVIATQNPVEHQGTFPLPEAQLDRFLFKIRMGYPTIEEGLHILKRFQTANPLDKLGSAVAAEDIVRAQESYTQVTVHDDLLLYMLQIVEETRRHNELAAGISPRGSQALLRAVQAQAVLQGRSFATPDDVKTMAVPVLAHRLIPAGFQHDRNQFNEQLINSLLREIPVPAEADPPGK